MKKYVLKRILLFLPTLLIISLLAFYISVSAPGDPVERLAIGSPEGGEQNQRLTKEVQKKTLRQQLGLDLPLFYFELSDAASPDTLYKITSGLEKETLQRLLFECGNWQAVADYWKSIQKFNSVLSIQKPDSTLNQEYTREEIANAFMELQTSLEQLKATPNQKRIEFHFQVIASNLSFLKLSALLAADFAQVKHCYEKVKTNKTRWKNYIPAIHVYAHNQYHRWLLGDGNWLTGKGSEFSRGVVRGDFGTSYSTKEPVAKKLGSHLKISLFFSLLSIFFAYLISIPLAARAALHPYSPFDKVSSGVLFAFYSLPSFFLATLLLLTFANTDVLNWFPASGLQPARGIPAQTGWLQRIWIHLPYCILPLICYTYSSLAFLSRTLRASLLDNLSLDYIRTARAKGLSEQKVVYKHAYKNALLPLITLFANVFPYAIGGSVILESIFTLPGMGLQTLTAIHSQDYPVIVAVFTLSGFMTLLGTLLADILYAFVDPRISFSASR